MRHFLFFGFLLGLSGCSGLTYIAENGVGQWKMFNRARPVDEVLASPYTSQSTREAIETVRAAKAFALTLGLKATGNYESFVQLDGPCVVWAVSAADPLELREKTWHFPVVGEVPYLGFFRQASADREAARLRAQSPSPDTWVRCVPAFSSLGWFSDPLYSSMLKGRTRDIVELVVHESLHATVWVGNSVDFNEKLANFVGLEGSLRHAQRAGTLAEAKAEVAGEKLFGDFLHGEVESYPRSVRNLDEKKDFYERMPDRYRNFLAKQKLIHKKMEVKFTGWNNAALLTYANYYSDFSVFEAMLRACGDDLARFVSWIVLEQKKGTGRFLSAPEEHLAEIVKGSSCPAHLPGGRVL